MCIKFEICGQSILKVIQAFHTVRIVLYTECYGRFVEDLNTSILLKEPFALKNSVTVYFTSIFSTPSYSDIAPIDNFDLTFFYLYFVFEVFDTIQF